MIGTTLTAVATAWLVAAEWIGARRQQILAKPLASLGFLLIPILEGVSTDAGAKWLMAGLVLGAVGDVLLIPGGSATFTAGLVAFLLGHVAFVVGFARAGDMAIVPAVAAALVMIAVAVTTLRWLRPHLERPFDIAVPVYVVVIGVMVVAAFGSTGVGLGAKSGAALFAASDITVARERFIGPNRTNRAFGLPMYYLAQVLIAWSAV